AGRWPGADRRLHEHRPDARRTHRDRQDHHRSHRAVRHRRHHQHRPAQGAAQDVVQIARQ
ncbi:hypothetical protein LTR94_038516, partial [Friedmanniomyces endolithicus]